MILHELRSNFFRPASLAATASIRSNLEARLGVITGILNLFTGLLSALPVTKSIETLSATAAYVAVLMVVIQAGSSGGGANSN